MKWNAELFKEVPHFIFRFPIYNYFHNESFIYAAHETKRMLNSS